MLQKFKQNFKILHIFLGMADAIGFQYKVVWKLKSLCCSLLCFGSIFQNFPFPFFIILCLIFIFLCFMWDLYYILFPLLEVQPLSSFSSMVEQLILQALCQTAAPSGSLSICCPTFSGVYKVNQNGFFHTRCAYHFCPPSALEYCSGKKRPG